MGLHPNAEQNAIFFHQQPHILEKILCRPGGGGWTIGQYLTPNQAEAFSAYAAGILKLSHSSQILMFLNN